jgi:multidrug efflux pump subunit AcrA (membrane-fusion protein)
MLHKWHRSLRHAAVLCAAVSLLTGCSLLPREEEMLEPPVFQKQDESYETAAVIRGNLVRNLSAAAVAESESSTTVAYAQSGGRLKELYVQEGDSIKRGDPIAELETGDLPLRIKLQKLTVEKRRLSYEKSSANKADPNGVRLAGLDLERENLVLGSLEKQYEQAMLYAPASGIVTYTGDLKPGDAVQASETVATIADPDRIRLLYTTTEPKSIAAVQPNTEVEIKFERKMYKGKVVQAPSNAPKSNDLKLNRKNATSMIIEFDDPKPKLQIGDYAEIKLFIEKRDNVLIIPRSALKSFLGRSYVQVMENGRIKEVDVQPGLSTQDGVEIIQGLEEGLQVIVD